MPVTVLKESTKPAPSVLTPGERMVGAMRPRPVTEFVELPPLLVNTTALLKGDTPGGLKAKPMFVAAEAETAKGRVVTALLEGSSNVNGPELSEAVPFKVAPPLLLTTNEAWALRPANTEPKLTDPGEITS